MFVVSMAVVDKHMSVIKNLKALKDIKCIDEDGTDIKLKTMDIEFNNVNNGDVISNHNIKELTCECLLSHISIFFQNVYLFHDTIMSNLIFVKSCATMEEVIETAKKAKYHDFIMRFSNGYDTVIGEGRATLSGGEKQRISIARAILKDTPIVMLDEATSSIDPENENYIQKPINELTKGKTVIIIAHRLSTVEHADQIIVINDGNVEAISKHNELILQDGTYKRLLI